MTEWEKAREAAAHEVCTFIRNGCLRCPFNADPAHAITRGCQAVASQAVDAALSAFSAAGWELVQKGDGWVRVPIEVENACLNWLANRIQGNSHGEDVELGRLMRGLQTYIQAVADGTNK